MQKDTSDGNLRPLAIALMVLAALVRVVQNLNFAPVGAMSLFCGARMRGWKAYVLPLALMVVTDPLVGGYSRATPLIYACFLLNVWIGTHLRKTENPLWIGSASMAGSVVFFLFTNFAFLFPTTYAHNFAGILQSYAAGIPFFGRTLASDLVYSAALFGLHAWLSRTVVRSERVAAAQPA
ncbi:MAG TPA: DUF6580 family putative transport protein [Bryobacteraceae bacterium]|nr:DUF6580 family putative transport protein [Bryobacteraceae bacterium]